MKRNKDGVILKLDFAEAYDRVNYQFLKFVLSEIGFGDKSIQWIMRCVSISSISILVNGTSESQFVIEKGLRKGCPMPPFLLI